MIYARMVVTPKIKVQFNSKKNNFIQLFYQIGDSTHFLGNSLNFNKKFKVNYNIFYILDF